MVMPLVTAVIPLYNKEQYVRRAIDSVLAQTVRHFELLVVNDGSMDNSRSIVREYTDARVRLIDQENRGVSAARNRGIAEARGELVAFLDADDEWLPDFLDTILALRERFPTAGAYATGLREFRGGKRVYRNRHLRGRRAEAGCCFDLWRRGAFVHSSCVAVPRQVFERIGAFREGYATGEDIDMWFRIALHFDIACSPAVCSLYHGGLPDNATHGAVPNQISPLQLSLGEMEADAAVSPATKLKARRFLKKRLATQIQTILLRGERRVAEQRLRQYYRIFGSNGSYVRLMVLQAMPPGWLRFLFRVRDRLVRWLLALRGLIAGKDT
jgi:glycosyltransferase involved in cell wall biosynthesis